VKRELALAVLALVALMLLGALGLAALVRAYGRPELLNELPEQFVPAVADFVVMQVLMLPIMISFAAGYVTYTTLTVGYDVREETAALASIGVAVLAWFAELLLLKYLLILMLGC